MTPTYAIKNGVRYRYYISAPLVQGQPQNAAPINRVPAAPIEKLIITAVQNHLELNAQKVGPGGQIQSPMRNLIATHIARVDVKQNRLAIQLSPVPDEQNEMQKTAGLQQRQHNTDNSKPPAGRNDSKAKLLIVPWKKPPSKQPRQIIPSVVPSSRQRPAPDSRRDPRKAYRRDCHGAAMAR